MKLFKRVKEIILSILLANNKPGENKEPLDGEDVILKLGMHRQSSYDKVPASVFNMTQPEKEQDWKRTSVWENSLTSDEQAVGFVTNPDRKLVVKMKVSEIRQIDGSDDIQHFKEFDVKWDYWYGECFDQNDNEIPDSPNGCKGHCGLEGLYYEDGGKRRSARRLLAEAASEYDDFYIYQED